MIHGYTKRKMRLMKINGCKSRAEAMLLMLKRLASEDLHTEINHVMGDLYYLERLARKAP